MQLSRLPMSLMGQRTLGSSENGHEREIYGDGTLRSSKRPDQGGMVDSRDAAELLQVFLAARLRRFANRRHRRRRTRRNGRLFSPRARAGTGRPRAGHVVLARGVITNRLHRYNM